MKSFAIGKILLAMLTHLRNIGRREPQVISLTRSADLIALKILSLHNGGSLKAWLV